MTSTMTLRSGKTLAPLVNNDGKRRTKMRALHDSILKQYRVFGSEGWPSLDEARVRSITTDEPHVFHMFCLDELFRVEDSGDKYAKRLCTLTVAESFMRSGPRVIQMYQPLLKVLYEKLKDAVAPFRAAHEVTPPDMREYLERLMSFQYSSVSPCVQ